MIRRLQKRCDEERCNSNHWGIPGCCSAIDQHRKTWQPKIISASLVRDRCATACLKAPQDTNKPNFLSAMMKGGKPKWYLRK